MAGYTRQSTYSDGDVIQASDSNNEFDQLVNAFANTTGHKHDGTANEGPVIGIIGDAGDATPTNKIEINTSNNTLDFYINVGGTTTKQVIIQDGAVLPVTDDDIDLGSSSKQFKDAYFDGTVNADEVSLGDDQKIKLGDSDDLQIYHESSSGNAVVQGAGNPSSVLSLEHPFNVHIKSQTTDNLAANFDPSGPQAFFYNGTGRLSTSATGINVTGTVDADEAQIDNINIDGNAITSTDTNGNIDITPNGSGEVNISKVDIDSGTIDGTAIGSTTTSTGAFTTVSASGGFTGDVTGNVTGNVTGTVSDVSNHDTDDISEGVSNLYFTNERVDDRVNALLTAGSNVTLTYDDSANTLTIAATEDDLSNNDTDDLSEGSSNLYYTQTRFDDAFSAKDTDDLSEGTTNLYYTDSRWDTRLGTKSTDDLTEGSNLYYTTSRANSAIDVRVNKAFVDNLNVDADTLDGLNSTDFDPAGEALALSIALG